MQENVKPRIAVWHWSKGEPVPDAKVVVCEPGNGWVVEANRVAATVHHERGGLFVVSGCSFNGEAPDGIISALHIRTQSDLARLPDLLAVKAERRALVCSPEEAIDLHVQLCVHCRAYAVRGNRVPVAWIPGTCRLAEGIDVVFIVGFDKPMHPSWVKGIVEQCRAAGVAVVLVTWGNWTPISESWPMDGRCEHAFIRSTSDQNELGISAFRTGPLYERATLDDEPVQDWPDWMGNA